MNRTVTAQVLIRSKSGRRVRGDVPITSENIAEYQPSAADAAAAQAAFGAAGFETGNLVGISFAITAAPELFESFFSTKLRFTSEGIVEVIEQGAATGYELPLAALPPSLAALVTHVTFGPPAELYWSGQASMF